MYSWPSTHPQGVRTERDPRDGSALRAALIQCAYITGQIHKYVRIKFDAHLAFYRILQTTRNTWQTAMSMRYKKKARRGPCQMDFARGGVDARWPGKFWFSKLDNRVLTYLVSLFHYVKLTIHHMK